MALVGNLTTYQHEESANEVETVTITYSEDLPLEHPDYEFRGQEVEKTVPILIETTELFENIYLHIHSYNVWKVDYSDYDLVNICYRVYESKEIREQDQNNFLFEEHLAHQNIDYSLEIGELEQCYAIVNNLRGFEELKKD